RPRAGRLARQRDAHRGVHRRRVLGAVADQRVGWAFPVAARRAKMRAAHVCLARRLALCLLAAAAVAEPEAHAQAPSGFQLNRYEPSSPGNIFFGVDHPWYSSTRYVAAGLTLDYGHDVLLGGSYPGGDFMQRVAIVEHQLVGRLEVAGAFLDRVQV